MVYFNSKFINLVGYCKYVRAIIFKENERGVAVYSISCVAIPILSETSYYIQSENYGDAKSQMSTGFVPYFKDNYYE